MSTSSPSSSGPRVIPLENWIAPPVEPLEEDDSIPPPYTLEITESFDGEYVAKYHLFGTESAPVNPGMIVVLDCSGSMGDAVRRLVRGILPKLLSALHYRPQDEISLIPFSSPGKARLCSVTAKNLRENTNNISASGTTHMAGVADIIVKVLNTMAYENRHAVRILLISDGQLNDTDKCLDATSAMMKSVPPGMTIHCQGGMIFIIHFFFYSYLLLID